MSNKSEGNKFEREFCDLLAEKGFWVHNMASKAEGQPADVIAVRKNIAYLIDCKVCSKSVFALSRIEENQHYAMRRFCDCGNHERWFALKLPEDGVYMISYTAMLIQESIGKSAMSSKDIMVLGIKFEEWCAKCS